MTATIPRNHTICLRIGLLLAFYIASANPLLAETVNSRILFASKIQEISTQIGGKGIAQLATALAYERSQPGSTIFLFGGDSLGPSLLGSFDEGAHIINQLNILGPDSMAIGSHELVYGWDTLVKRIKEAKFPVLSANLIGVKTGEAIPGALPYKVFKLGSLTLGVASVIAEEALINFIVPEAQIADRSEAIKSTIKAMQTAGVDITALLMDSDLSELDRIRNEQKIDIVLISDSEETAVRSDNQGIIARQGGTNHLIAIDIQVTEEDKKWSASPRIVPISNMVANKKILGITEGFRSELSVVLNKKIGKIERPIDTTKRAVRTRENAFGNFIADALRQTMGGDVALINGGAIRGDRIYEIDRSLTRRDLLTELPYTSYPILIEVTGQQLRNAVENGLSGIESMMGRFLHMSNIKVVYDPNRWPGQRVIEIMVDGKEINSNATYKLSTIDYLANGGDDFDMFKDAKRLTPPDHSNVLWYLVAKAVTKAKGISTRREGRLTVRNTSKTIPLPTFIKIKYSEEESNWIATNPVITVGATPDWPPFEYVEEDGAYKGITADLLRLAATRAGLKLKIVTEPWSHLLQKLKDGEIDLAPGLPITSQRETFLDFTKPIFESPHVIISRKSREDVSFFDTLLDKVVAVEESYYLQEFYEEKHPNMKLLKVPTTLDALKAVSEGRADAYIGANVVASYLIEKNFFVDLKIASYLQGKPMRLRMGATKSSKHLRNILQKAIDTITNQERRVIVDRYVQLGLHAKKTDIPVVPLSDEEKAWLAEHKTIRMGVDPAYPPFDFIDDNGNHAGMAADFVALIAERLDINTTVIPNLSWAQVLKGAKKGAIDVLPAAGDSQDRRKYLNFTRPYIKLPIVVMGRNDHDAITGLTDLKGQTVALVKGYYYINEITQNYQEITQLLVDTPLEGLKAVSLGRADAVVVNLGVGSYLAQKETLVNLKVIGDAGLKTGNLSIGVRKDWPELVGILEKTLATITHGEQQKIRNKWVGISADGTSAAKIKVELTPEESAWIAQNPTVRLAPDPDFPPIEFFDDTGKYQGLAADLVRMVTERVGIKIEIVPKKNWEEVLGALQNHDADMSAAMPKDKDNVKYLNFTKPYDEFPSVIIVRKETEGRVDMAALSGLTVAVVSGWPEEKWVLDNHPDINVVSVPDTISGLEKVAFGDAEAMVSFLPTASYYISKRGMTNLRIAGRTTLEFPDAFAVRKDWPELISILQKGLNSVTEEEHLALNKKWISIDSERKPMPQVPLTEHERIWLQKHKVVRVGGDSDYPPFEFFDSAGVYRGMAADYLDLIGKRIGIEFKRTPGFTWKQVVEELEARGLDMAPVMTPTNDRKKFLFFSQPYLTYPQVLVTRDDHPPIAGLGDFKGKTVAVTKGYSEIENIRRMYPKMEMLTVDGPLEELKAVSERRADVSSGNLAIISYLLQKHNLLNLKIASPSDVEGGGLCIGVRKDWPELVSIIDKALDTITPKEQQEIRTKWGVADPSEQETTVSVELTPEERKWLREHEPLRLGTDPDWPPIDFIGPDATYQGIASDYLRLAAQRLGVAVELVGKFGWTDTLDKMKARNIDILSTISETPERAEYMNFTAPFIKFPIVVLTRDDSPFIGGIKELSGRRVAVVKDYRAHIKMQENHPDIQLAVVGNMTEGLKAVSEGKAFAFVGNLATSTFVLKKEGITNLKVAAPTPYAYNQAIGVRKDWGELVPILDKALASVTEQERNRIYNKWISLRFEHAVDYTLIWKIAAVFATVITVILLWTMQIRRQREAIRISGERLGLALEGGDLGSWDLDLTNGKTVVNERWAEILGYSLEETDDPSQIGLDAIHPQDRERVIQTDRDYRKGILSGYEVEYRAITKQGNERWLISKGAIVRRDDKGQPLRMVGTVMDVTESKEAERKLADAFGVITSSINYASRIQRAILPPMELLDDATREYFILWKPRDVVGGDIYWCHKWGSGMVLILADCTGHGVPGAFMTLISNGALERALIDVSEGDSAALISKMHQLIQVLLGQDRKESEADDGLELGVCYISSEKNNLVFAGAGFPIFVTLKNEVSMIKGDRKGIGYRKIPIDTTWTNKVLDVQNGSCFYMSSDGIFDQIGGPKRRGYGKKRFMKLLKSIQVVPITEQGDAIYQQLVEYQGEEKRRDDVSAIGFKIIGT